MATRNKGNRNPMFGKKHSEETKQRMREKALGRKAWNKGLNKKDNPDKIKYGKKGEEHHNWKGGVSIYRQLIELKQCNRCRGTTHIQVHHLDKNRNNNDINNLEVLCASCHAKEHDKGRTLPLYNKRDKKGRYTK